MNYRRRSATAAPLFSLVLLCALKHPPDAWVRKLDYEPCSEAAEPGIPTRRTKVPRGPDLDHTGAVAGAAIFSFSSLQVLRTSAVISEQSSI
jgi:hypothetical protein